MPDIDLPAFGWRPRDYQMDVWRYLEGGGKRAYVIAHRRWGKDDLALNWAATAAFEQVGNYWHMLPEASQARKAIWDAVNPHTGRRRINEAFPLELRSGTRENEMMIKLVNGSTWQVVGSDNYDSLVGATPVGIVFSEWALSNPVAWAMLRPILLENGGWACFITTPRGRNHAATFYEGAKDDPKWFVKKSTVYDTNVFTSDQLAQEKLEYIREFGEEDGRSKFEQEYECSFDAAIQGSYYGKLMQAMEDEGRVGFVPYDPRLPVLTAWDLGYGDTTPIWFAQFNGPEIRLIDFLEASGVGLDWYAAELGRKPYVYNAHFLPHDADVGELGTGKRRIDVLRGLGLSNMRVVPKLGVDDGISAVRSILPRCRIDRDKCARGLSALQQYRKSYDEVNKVFRPKPHHDWCSHPADALRYLAVGMKDRVDSAKPKRRETLVLSDGWMAA